MKNPIVFSRSYPVLGIQERTDNILTLIDIHFQSWSLKRQWYSGMQIQMHNFLYRATYPSSANRHYGPIWIVFESIFSNQWLGSIYWCPGKTFQKLNLLFALTFITLLVETFWIVLNPFTWDEHPKILITIQSNNLHFQI